MSAEHEMGGTRDLTAVVVSGTRLVQDRTCQHFIMVAEGL